MTFTLNIASLCSPRPTWKPGTSFDLISEHLHTEEFMEGLEQPRTYL